MFRWPLCPVSSQRSWLITIRFKRIIGIRTKRGFSGSSNTVSEHTHARTHTHTHTHVIVVRQGKWHVMHGRCYFLTVTYRLLTHKHTRTHTHTHTHTHTAQMDHLWGCDRSDSCSGHCCCNSYCICCLQFTIGYIVLTRRQPTFYYKHIIVDSLL